jgi:hypothetical protein
MTNSSIMFCTFCCVGDKTENSEIGCTCRNEKFVQILNRKLQAQFTRETWVRTDNTKTYFIQKCAHEGVDRIQSFEVSQWHG